MDNIICVNEQAQCTCTLYIVYYQAIYLCHIILKSYLFYAFVLACDACLFKKFNSLKIASILRDAYVY